MLIKDIIKETASAGSTGSGSIAAVNTPLGDIIKRPNPSIYNKKKKKKAEEARRLIMRAVKDKNKYLNLISSTEAKLFNKIDLTGFVNVNSLDEREQYIAEEMYKKDVLQKVTKGEKVGYKIYPQKEKI